MKFGTGSNTELTQKYVRVKVQNDIRTSKHINKHPQFSMCYPCKCLTCFARSPNIHLCSSNDKLERYNWIIDIFLKI